MINPKDLSNEELINKYYHTRQDAEAYEVSKDVEMLPLLKQELKDRLSRKDYENKAGEACIALEKILSGRQATNITDDECKFASMNVEAKRQQDNLNYIRHLQEQAEKSAERVITRAVKIIEEYEVAKQPLCEQNTLLFAIKSRIKSN
jgi:ribonuclease D